MPVSEGDKIKTTYTSHAGINRFNEMSFGLMNAPAKFQHALDKVLKKYTWKSGLVYLDNNIIFSKTKNSISKTLTMSCQHSTLQTWRCN